MPATRKMTHVFQRRTSRMTSYVLGVRDYMLRHGLATLVAGIIHCAIVMHRRSSGGHHR